MTPAALASAIAAAKANPALLDAMTPDQKVEAARSIIAQHDQRHAGDCYQWLIDRVWTVDEASQERIRWPDKGYLREAVAVLDSEPMVAIPKSRRMMVTWLIAAWSTHKARFHPNHAIFIQSETEDKAAFVTDKRCAYIEDNIEPAPFRRDYAAIRTSKGAIGRITYKKTESYIWAIPQGGAVIRTFTPSILVMDESEYQPEAHAALVAALPIVEKGAKLVLVSSSNGPSGVIAGIAKELGFINFPQSGIA